MLRNDVQMYEFCDFCENILHFKYMIVSQKYFFCMFA